MRWVVKLNSLRFVIKDLPKVSFHSKETESFLPDNLTRWIVHLKDTLASGTIARLVTVPPAPMDYDEDDWSSIEDILNSQRAATVPVPDGCTFGEIGLAQFPGGVVWIPDEDKLMQQRLLIPDQPGPGGHRDISSTTFAMRDFVPWISIDKDVNSLVSVLAGSTLHRCTADTC
jgi:hypothetical protein